jgi:hypothetical protein
VGCIDHNRVRFYCFKATPKSGFEPFTASVDFIRGAADYDDLAILSDTVVIGRVLQVDEATLGDGYGSTIQFEVEEAIAGNVPQRTRLQIRQVR